MTACRKSFLKYMVTKELEIFLFIDALGWELVSKTAFMEKELPFRHRVEMQFGYSSTAIPTILSGKAPAVHGHLGLFRFAPKDSPFKGLGKIAPFMKPESFWNRGRVRHWLSKIVGKIYGFTGYFQLYQVPFRKLALMDYCEKNDLFAEHGMGDVENLRDLLVRENVPYHISDWHGGDAKSFEAARQAIKDGAKFLFIYTAELDALLHQYPVLVHDKIREKLAWYQREIELLLKECSDSGRQFRLTVISDHGMTPLTKTVDVRSAIDGTGLVFGKDYGICYDSTLIRATFLSKEAEEKIRNALRPFENEGHWLSEDEEKRYGIYRSDRYFGDAIFLMNPGVQIAPSDMGARPLNGMHGFAPEDKDSQAVILSTDEIPDSVSRVADYLGLMKSRIEAMKNSKSS